MKYRYSNWMEHNTSLHSRILKEICLPASHDSGAYSLTDTMTEEPSAELKETLEKVKEVADAIDKIPGIGKLINVPEWIFDAVITPIKNVSTATSRTILEQLEDGIRCFDLRVYHDGKTKQFYTYHGLIGVDVAGIMADFKQFLAENHGEILYITMGHWLGFKNASDYEAFNQLVLNEIGDHAYIRDSERDNNPFNATYSEIIGQGGAAKSRVILVNGSSQDPRFWPTTYSPPDNSAHGTVISGYYTDTSDLQTMLTTQKRQFANGQGKLPFALYLTLTPQKEQILHIVTGELSAAVAKLGINAFVLGHPVIATALESIAAGLAIYKSTLPWTSLRGLSEEVGDSLLQELSDNFQPFTCIKNQIAMIYADFYEDTSLVEAAILYSGGVPPGPHKTTLKETSNAGPALAGFGGRLYLAWKGHTNNTINVMDSADGGYTWGPKKELEETSNKAVSLAVYKDTLYLCWKGTDNRINIMASSDGTNWGEKYTFPHETTSARPSLAATKDALYIAWKGHGNAKLNIIESPDGKLWQNKRTLAETSSNGPDLVPIAQRTLCLVWTGHSDHRINLSDYTDGFKSKTTLSDTSSATPSLAALKDTLYLAWRGNDNTTLNLDYSSCANQWGQNKVELTEKSGDSPALATVDEQLYLAWTGTDAKLNLLLHFNLEDFG